MLAEDTPQEAEELSPSDFLAEADPTPALVEEKERDFGRYRLKFQIASGGMASVFLAGAAGAAGFEKPVAIKRMHPHLARRKAYVDMFLDEAQITSRINHPNVCQVFDFGENEGAYYMAMEYLVGEPLTTLLAHVKSAGVHKSNSWQAIAARICASVAEGLHAAHELRDSKGESLEVVHRDVSPSNIIVTFDGGVKVVDFGVAKARGRVHQTTTGALKGKFSYMAPEQVSGKGVDRRSDVWSVGVVLWEMLTLKRLFRRASEMETLIAVGQGEIPAPTQLVQSVPDELSAIALKALSRDPATRHASARELARDLERWIRSQEQPTGMADIADFLAKHLEQEHHSKALFVQTAMHERGADMPVASAQTRVLDAGTPSHSKEIPPFSESQSHTRPRSSLEEQTANKPAPKRPVLLLGIASVLGAALIAAVIGIVFAVTADDGPSAVQTPKRTAPRAPAPLVEQDGRGEETGEEETGGDDANRGEQEGEQSGETDTELAALERIRQLEEELARRAERGDTRPTTPAMRAATRATGTVFISSVPPGATIVAGGQNRGEAPKQFRLPAGRQVITLRLGSQRRRVTVEVPANGRITRRVDLR